MLCVSMMIAGCAQTAYKVTPIPISEELNESVVACDPGFVLSKIALIDIDGVLVNARESSLLTTGENKMAMIVEKLRKASEDSRVKAVVLRINSPGGSVTASDILYNEVQKVRKGDPCRRIPGKPVVASMQDVAASGGYYISCAADQIVAEPTTVTGSIGVVMMTWNAKGLLDKVGVSTDAIKSGPNKDAGSPFRPMKPEERQIFQSMIDEYYQRFLTIVGHSRTHLKPEKIRELADGRVYTGRQALKLGLVDYEGSLDDALILAKDLAGMKSARVVMYHRPVGYSGSIYAAAEINNPKISASTPLINVPVPDYLQQQGSFLYLWQP
jgi:protease-4